MREKIEEALERACGGDLSDGQIEAIVKNIEPLLRKSNMHWKMVKEKDKEGTFTVRPFNCIASSSDGEHIHKMREGLIFQMKDGREYLVTWGEIFKDLLSAIDKDNVELALEEED